LSLWHHKNTFISRSQLVCTDLLHTPTMKTVAAVVQFNEQQWSVFSQ